MRDAENEVTQADREAAAKVRPYSHNSALILDGERDATDIVQAACYGRLAAVRDMEAEIARLTAERDRQYDENVSLISENARRITERDQLRAELEEAGQILMAVVDFEEDHTDPACQDKHPFLARARAFLASAPEPEPVQKLHELPDEASIKHMVDRFLGWRLPADFSPDGGIIFSHTSGGHANAPTGTNLFTATQAEAMVRYMMEVAHDR